MNASGDCFFRLLADVGPWSKWLPQFHCRISERLQASAQQLKTIAFVNVLVSASEMFSIAGTAEHPRSASNLDEGTTTEVTTSSKAHESAGQAPRAVTLSAPLATLLAAQYANAAEHMLLGKLQGRNQPSARELVAWCKKHLHATFLHMTCLGLGYFEVAFSSPDGKQDTLRRSGFFLGELELEVVFSPWQPSFEPEDPACVNAFSYAIWAQFCGLNALLRTKECLTEIGKHIGEVLAVEEDEANRAQAAGLRVRILVSTEDLNALPQRIELPQIGNFRGKTCKVMYSGLPERCHACATFAHSPQNCPVDDDDDSESNDSPEVGASGSKKGNRRTSDLNLSLQPWRLHERCQTTVSLPESRAEPESIQDGPGQLQAKCHTVENAVVGKLELPGAETQVRSSHKLALAASTTVNSQYSMTLSGPLSAPHSPQAHSSQESACRWANSCAGISIISTKFSSRPAYHL